MLTDLLLVVHGPVADGASDAKPQRAKHAHLVVVTGAQIDHDMLVPMTDEHIARSEMGRCPPIKEHDCTGIV